MPRLKKFDVDPVDVDADGLCQSQSPAGAGNLTLNGALISGGSYTAGDGDAGRQISITSNLDDSGQTFTVTGTDADGNTQTEDITGPNGTTVESSKYWATVTQIAIDGAATGNIEVGTVDELATPTYPLDRFSDVGALVQIDITGTIDLTAQVTVANIRDTFADQEAIPWINTGTTGLVTASADAIGRVEAGATAARVIVNSHSSGGEAQIYISEEHN